jgi:tetratricopeptide (TPR) repeat protein
MTLINNRIEDTTVETEETPAKPLTLTLGRTQVWGVIGIVALLALGVMYRSNGDSGSSDVAVDVATTVQKGLLQTAEDALAINPQDSDAWYTKGVALQLELGDIQGAVESYSRAIEINPQYFSALFNRGLAYKALGRLDEAKADFTTIVTLKDGVAPQALYNLGLIAIDQGDIPLSDEYLQKAYEQDATLQP